MLLTILSMLIAAGAGFALATAIYRATKRSDRIVNPLTPQPYGRGPEKTDAANLRVGRFNVTPDKQLLGELRIAGAASLITLRDDDVFHIEKDSDLCITGTLFDQRQVTLVECVRLQSTHASSADGRQPSSVDLFPHFVLEGRTHISPKDGSIREVHFTFEDAATLFYDFDAFGSLLDPAPHIANIVQINEQKLRRAIPVGPDPRISYFTGRTLIIEAPTVLGTIRIHHAPSYSLGGPRGVRIDNEIWISVEPDCAIDFEAAVDAVGSLLRFIAIGVGRAQALPKFAIDVGTSESPQILDVHWSHHPQRSRSAGERIPHPADTPLDPIDHPDEFKSVLSAWLKLDSARRIARVRVHEAFTQGNFFTTERLIAVANAFDLLPPHAVPKRVELTNEVLEAKRQGKAIFRKLPPSEERESLFRAVGRLGHATLKQKVRHRVGFIKAAVKDRFPDLEWLCDQAVECRNHFVHGSAVDFPVDGPTGAMGFLTDTLEFVFLTSELIECGWDIKRFLATPTSQSHPFGEYRVNYELNLEQFRASIVPSPADDDS